MPLSLADPSGSSALVAAAEWVQATLLGTVATTIAIIAVASVGLLMLGGRLELRRAASVIIGCFILFGATTIVAGIQGAASGLGPPSPGDTAPAVASPPVTPTPSKRPQDYDPYAGASVPRS